MEKTIYGEEFFAKLIKTILTQADQGKALKKSASNSKMSLFKPETDINPPVLFEPNYPLQVRQILQCVQSFLDIEPTIFFARVDEINRSLTRNTVIQDLLVYKYFLQKGYMFDNEFKSQECFQSWKRNEEMWIGNNKTPYSNLDQSRDLILLSIISLANLKPKDQNNYNNPYVSIRYIDQEWISPVIQKTCNPTFDFNIPIIISKNAREPITISVWNRLSMKLRNEKSSKEDNFLGCVRLSVGDLENLIANPSNYPLQKRSKRSNVNGSIQLGVKRVINPIENGTLQSIPTNPIQSFRNLLSALYEWEMIKTGSQQQELSELSSHIVNAVKKSWRIREQSSIIAFYEIAGSMYTRKFLNIDTLHRHFSLAFDVVHEVDNCTHNEEALSSRFGGLHAISTIDNEEIPLIALTKHIIEELEFYKSEYDMLIFGGLDRSFKNGCRRLNLLDFIKGLDWPNEQDTRKFYYEVYKEAILALNTYCYLLTEALIRELTSTRHLQPPPYSIFNYRPAKKAKIGKIKVTIPKMIRKKQIASSFSGERISAKACVCLLNISAVTDKFKAALDRLPVLQDESSRNYSTFQSKKFVFSVNIVEASLQVTRPWITKIAIKLVNRLGKEIGGTQFLPQRKLIRWDETLFSVYNANVQTVSVCLLHSIEGHQEVTFAVGQLDLSELGILGSMETKIQLASYGWVRIKCQVLDDNTDVLLSMCQWVTRNYEQKIVSLFVNQLTYDFRDRIHPLSLKYKTNVVTKFFKDQSDLQLTPSEIEEIEEYLSPLFEFLNSNLEVLMSNIEDIIAFKVVDGIWSQFVHDAEAMIVPSLGEDPKERKQWDERRFQFFIKYMELASYFFIGEGRDANCLDLPCYLALKNIIQHYFAPKEELVRIYKKSPLDQDYQWALKLIKMKGGKEQVEAELQRQTEN
ncbi:hypothetical protein HK103_005948 [Boothiomyces macroporosus]|uniref:C2 domain-containing protein n=1 Tax=Boothiomyces macroporosus TaxID=261099 RepID=A0AAD5Y5Y4_9FUNG|nr:hypothetical protein HK103_005948 [Boothiomyces macroporosus]